MVNSQDISDGAVAEAISFRVSSELSQRFSRSVLKGGEVLVTLVGANFGRVAVAPPRLAGFNTARPVGVVPVEKHPEFVALALRSPFAQRLMQVWANTTAQPTLNLKELGKLPVPVPPDEEVSKIASALSALDAKIELNRRMNRTIESATQALFDSWFVAHHPVLAKAEKGPPKQLEPADGWQIRTLGDLAEVVDCLHSKKPVRVESGPTLLQLDNILDDGTLDLTSTYSISPADYANWTSRMEAREGDCVITNVGRVGAAARIPRAVMAALGRNMTGIRLRAEFPFPAFLITLLTSRWMREEIADKTDSGTILDALNVRSIPTLRVPWGGIEIVAAFERLAAPLRSRMEGNLVEIGKLTALRDALLPRLVSGEIRLAGARSLKGI